MSDTCLSVQDDILWKGFTERESLTVCQEEQFKRYYQLLNVWNARMNLTTIVELKDVIAYHFQDSLALGHEIKMNSIRSLADIGSGAGFPGIPLKIRYPQLHVILSEVTQKKVNFLKTVIQELSLTNIEVESLDWLTFLRHDRRMVDLFCARASLAPHVLVTLFEPWCRYKTAHLVYWASMSWQADEDVAPFLYKEATYTVGQKMRKLIFFKAQ